MKFSVNTTELLSGLQKVMGAVEKRNTMPALGHVLLEVKDDSLTLTGTDLEIMLRARVACRAEAPFRLLIPGRKLLDICKTVPEQQQLNFSLQGLKATVVSGRSRFSLACLDGADFPQIELGMLAATLTISKSRLQNMLAHTAFAMANQDVRYYLNGLLIKVEPERLTVVGTDGHRLSLYQANESLEIDSVPQVIVPRKGVGEIQKLLGDFGDQVRIELTGQHIRIAAESVEFTSKLIDARFPDYERVVPRELPNRVVFAKRLLKEALTRVAILSNERYRGVRLSLTNNLAKVEAHNAEQEQAEEDLEVSYSGDALEIGFNVQYLQDVIGVIEGDEVELRLNDPNSSILVSDPKNSDARYVIMPMRL